MLFFFPVNLAAFLALQTTTNPTEGSNKYYTTSRTLADLQSSAAQATPTSQGTVTMAAGSATSVVPDMDLMERRLQRAIGHIQSSVDDCPRTLIKRRPLIGYVVVTRLAVGPMVMISGIRRRRQVQPAKASRITICSRSLWTQSSYSPGSLLKR